MDIETVFRTAKHSHFRTLSLKCSKRVKMWKVSFSLFIIWNFFFFLSPDKTLFWLFPRETKSETIEKCPARFGNDVEFKGNACCSLQLALSECIIKCKWIRKLTSFVNAAKWLKLKVKIIDGITSNIEQWNHYKTLSRVLHLVAFCLSTWTMNNQE